MAKTLYISYFGVREPLVRTQVIPYLREIMKGDTEVALLTFEPDLKGNWTAGQIDAEKKNLAEIGIEWHCLPYHKRFSAIATAYDVLSGAWLIRRIIDRENIDILHGRVHIPTLVGAIARKFSRRKPKLLFDIRGFFPEEYTDAGIWPEGGLLYRAAKRIERWLLTESDGFVVLTEKARDILFPESKETGFNKIGKPVEVIPCCVDFDRFASATAATRIEMRAELGVDDRIVVTYVGSFGGWYLTDETADFYGELRRLQPNVFALILTQNNPEIIEPMLRANGFKDGDFLIARVPPAEIPRYLSAADIAISFAKQSYSKLASSPTKNAEYLASGLPIVANSGIGDFDELITKNHIGAVIKNFTPADFRSAYSTIQGLENVGDRCREVANREFDLESVGGVRYRRLYRRLLDGEISQ